MHRFVESMRSAFSSLTPPMIPDVNTIVEIINDEPFYLPNSHPTTVALADCVDCLRKNNCQRPDLHEAYPDDLKIDKTAKLNGKMKHIARHLVVATGIPASQWPSKLERNVKMTDDTDPDQQAMMLPALLNNEIIEAWARGAVDDGQWVVGCVERLPAGELMIFPEYQCVQLLNEHDKLDEALPTLDRITHLVEDLAFGEGLLTDSNTDQGRDNLPVPRLIRQPIPYRAVILICAHARRDKRCGITGPILHRRFTAALAERGEKAQKEVGVFMISHTDGQKIAGNVILYPAGIWYGLVNTCHIDAILDRTVYGNEVIRELYRGRISTPASMTQLSNNNDHIKRM